MLTKFSDQRKKSDFFHISKKSIITYFLKVFLKTNSPKTFFHESCYKTVFTKNRKMGSFGDGIRFWMVIKSNIVYGRNYNFTLLDFSWKKLSFFTIPSDVFCHFYGIGFWGQKTRQKMSNVMVGFVALTLWYFWVKGNILFNFQI